MKPPPAWIAREDVEAIEAERDALRAALEQISLWQPRSRTGDLAREALKGESSDGSLS